jgi:hypothetical protein
MSHATPQIPLSGTHGHTEASLSTSPRGHRDRPSDGRETRRSRVLASRRDVPSSAIFGLKRPMVRADTGNSGGLRRRSGAHMILPQVRSDAAGSPTAPKPNVTTVSVESRPRSSWMALPPPGLSRMLSTDRSEVRRSAEVSPASATSWRLRCTTVEDNYPINTVMMGYTIQLHHAGCPRIPRRHTSARRSPCMPATHREWVREHFCHVSD